MQSPFMLAVCCSLFSISYSPMIYAEDLIQTESSATVLTVALMIMLALSVYVVIRIRSTIRYHLDKPAK
jgi:hypothetical protein